MVSKSLRLTAGFLVSALVISSIPAEAFAADTSAEAITYISEGAYSFSAGALSAMNETIVLKEEDDSVLAAGDTGVTENDAPTVSQPEVSEQEDSQEAADSAVSEEETAAETVSPYANIAIANNINSYLNVRTEPNTESEAVGKLYKNNAAVVLETVGDWYKITSGNITGYISAKYVTVGDEAVCKSASTMTAKITTNSLRLRKEASTESGIYTLLGKGQKVTVLNDETEGWLYIQYKSYKGYISAEYAEVTINYEYGETKEEEKAREEKEKAEAEAAAKKKEEAKKQQSSSKTYKNPTGSDGQAVVDYALQFVGNKYVWGGESLTNGVDCSGFVMKVYEKFGIDLPHSSYKLRKVGTKVSASDLQPGDIICYSGHVAIYIGDGKIVHASNKKDGIKITNNYKYKKVITIRRVL